MVAALFLAFGAGLLDRLRRAQARHFDQPQDDAPAAPRSYDVDYRRDITATPRIMNFSEARFLGLLAAARPDCHAFPQVSFSALLMPHASVGEGRSRRVRREFGAKRADFVLCRRDDMSVMAVIEYDGPGHVDYGDARRDTMLRMAGYRVERFTEMDTAESVRARLSGPGTGPARALEGLAGLPPRFGRRVGST